MKVKPKRPARKCKTRKSDSSLTVESWLSLPKKLEQAEADKRILLDENLKLQSEKNDWIRRWDEDSDKAARLANGIKGNLAMLDALCRAHDRSNYMYMVAEHDFLLTVAERDALAKRNQELASVNVDLWRRIRAFELVDRTSCQMGFSESKGVKP